MVPSHLDKQYFKIIVLHVQWELRLLGHSQTSREARGALFAAEAPGSHISRGTHSGGLVPATRRVPSPSLRCCRASAPLEEHTRKRDWSLKPLPNTLPTRRSPILACKQKACRPAPLVVAGGLSTRLKKKQNHKAQLGRFCRRWDGRQRGAGRRGSS